MVRLVNVNAFDYTDPACELFATESVVQNRYRKPFSSKTFTLALPLFPEASVAVTVI